MNNTIDTRGVLTFQSRVAFADSQRPREAHAKPDRESLMRLGGKLTMRFSSLLALLFLGSLTPAPLRAQPVIDCNMFWANGLPLAGHTRGLPVHCKEHDPGPGTTALLAGYEYRIFIAEKLELTDAVRMRLDWLAEAIDDVVGQYHRIGGAVRFYIYVSDQPFAADPSVLASRSVDYDYAEPCPIFFYPVSMADSYDEFKHILAHEAFHCIQSSKYWPQRRAGGSAGFTDWWAEGTAEYFANTVYPDENREWNFSRRYDPDASLLAQSYEVNFFFQDLANRIDDEGILHFLASLPTVSGAEYQQNAFAAFPGVQDHVHGFGQRYLDQRVHDTGVLLVGVSPEKGDVVPIGGPATLTYVAPAFTLVRNTLEFAPGKSYRIAVDTAGDGRFSARAFGGSATWGPLPDEIVTDCTQSTSYEILATSAVPVGARAYEVDIAITAEPACEFSCVETYEHDSCLVGTWVVDRKFMEDQMQALLRGRATIAPIAGEERVTYYANGLAKGGVDTASQQTLHLEGVDVPQSVTTVAEGDGVWSTAGSTLFTCPVSEVANVTASGQVTRRPLQGARIPAGVSFPYACSGDVLELTLPGGFMKKRYNRVSK